MERKLVTIEDIKELRSIEGADAIEAARVRDWWVVVKKGDFKVGDLCRFYEVDSFLPIKPEYEFLLKGSKPKRMLVNGKEIEGIRLKTIRLRGQLSQGLIMPITEEIISALNVRIGDDITDIMEVIKYEPAVPGCLANVAKGNFPSFLQKTDEERIQNCAQLLDLYKNTLCYVTEKIDGTSATYYKYEGVFGACSRNMDLKESDSVYWKIAEKLNLKEILPDEICIQGEIVGEGIQSNPLKLKGQEFYLFNVYDIKENRYFNFLEMTFFAMDHNIKMVPVLKTEIPLNFTVDQLLRMADSKSELNKEVLREGVVIRSMVEQNVCERGCPTRLSFKAINNSYLLEVEK